MNVYYTSPEIDILAPNEDDEFELRFYLMMFCHLSPDSQVCIDSGDHVLVRVYDNDDNDIVVQDYTFENIYPIDVVEKRMWIEQNITFNITQATKIKVPFSSIILIQT